MLEAAPVTIFANTLQEELAWFRSECCLRRLQFLPLIDVGDDMLVVAFLR